MDTARVMLAAAILLAVTGIALLAARKIHAGSIVALLAAGMLLGPHTPYPVIASHIEDLQQVGEAGVILLLFLVALDIQPARLWEKRRAVLVLGAGQYVLATAAVMSLVLAVTPLGWKAALLVGLGLAMSSGAIAFGTLEERRDGASSRGRTVLAVQVFQSIMVAPVLAFVPLLATQGDVHGSPGAIVFAILAIAVVCVLALFVLPTVLRVSARTPGPATFGLFVFSAVLFASWIADRAGISAAMGAFLLGLLLSGFEMAERIKAVVAPAKQLLLALLFLSIGMAIDPGEVFAQRWDLLVLVPGVFVAKLATGYIAARAGHVGRENAFMASLVLAPLDEIAYVIFASARAAGLMDDRAYAIALSGLSISFVLAPLAIDLGYRWLEKRGHAPSAESVDSP